MDFYEEEPTQMELVPNPALHTAKNHGASSTLPIYEHYCVGAYWCYSLAYLNRTIEQSNKAVVHTLYRALDSHTDSRHHDAGWFRGTSALCDCTSAVHNSARTGSRKQIYTAVLRARARHTTPFKKPRFERGASNWACLRAYDKTMNLA